MLNDITITHSKQLELASFCKIGVSQSMRYGYVEGEGGQGSARTELGMNWQYFC